MIRVGTAGWSIPAGERGRFSAGDSLLARYAHVFDLVEINSSFYQPHQRKTYERWAAAAPPGFRFAVKAPRAITHERRLVDAAAPLERFLGEIKGLGDKRGPVLIQLPPSLEFEPAVAARFFALWRSRFSGETALEPRHASWFSNEADTLLAGARIARVAADPPPSSGADIPGGWRGLVYLRLHGAPEVYASPYAPARVEALLAGASIGADAAAPSYVVFDNTRFGAATADALALIERLAAR